LIVAERTPEAFCEALLWCERNIELVREMGAKNAARMRSERSWEAVAPQFKYLFSDVLASARRPRFRNDDVSWDTPFRQFEEFCSVFWESGFTQVHGVTLRGRVCAFGRRGTEATEYDGIPSLASLPNAKIRELSEPFRFEERTDLIAFLASSLDEIALHGLYHSDYSALTENEQRADIAAGLEILDRLFPKKVVRYFIAPFNRTNDVLYEICREFDLEVLAAEGVHLEQQIMNLSIKPNTLYRYHHHRFYPESTCAFYPTTIESLKQAFKKNSHALVDARS
jgi:peptidoglycan/xylan/chitin deacetylase (PgdA/CDA1 family)